MKNPHTCYESFVPFEDLGVAQTWLPLRLCTLIPPSHAQTLKTLHTCSESFVTFEKLKACAITRAPQDPQLRMRILILVIAIFLSEIISAWRSGGPGDPSGGVVLVA